MPAHDSPLSLFIRFLKFGALAWGGPAAQIEAIHRECVVREGWVSEETFKRTIAVYQVLPGPEATELCVYLGRMRGGKLGGLLAGLGFVLPGFVLMLAMSVLYVEADLAGKLDDVFYGLQAAVGAVVVAAVIRLGRSFVTDVPLAAIALAAFGLTLGLSASFVLVLLLAGIAYELWANGAHWARRVNSVAPALVLPLVLGAVTASLTADVFLEGLKAGLLTFGGAFTVIPFLQEAAVDTHHWVTQDQFLDGLAISGVLPSPLIIFATFVGYLAGGMAGALAMTFGIFLPAFVLPIFLHHLLVRVAESPRIRAFLLGVAAGAIGLIAAVAVDIVDAGVEDVPTALLAAGAFAALMRWRGRLTVLYVVAGCGVAGVLLQLAGA